MTNPVTGGDWRCYRSIIQHRFGLLLTLLLSPAICFPHEIHEYNCKPDIKYECTADQCEKKISDFQQAESFSYNTKTDVLSACLWTNCYADKATVFRDAASGTLTVVASLIPTAHPGNEPILVSLTIDTRDTYANPDFTAVWGYRGNGLTFDMGKCELRIF